MRKLPTIDLPLPTTQRGKPKSIFDTRTITSLHEEIRAIYPAEARTLRVPSSSYGMHSPTYPSRHVRSLSTSSVPTRS
jgi:hypothetical protein